MGDVRTTHTLDNRDVERALEKMNRDMIKLREQNSKLAQETRRGSGSSVASIAKMAAGYAAVKTVVFGVLQQQREFTREIEASALALDKSIRKLRIQGNLNGLQGEQAQGRIAKIAGRTGVDQQAVGRIATEAISQGFKSPLKGGTVETLISFLQSTGVDVNDADLESIVGGFSKFLTAGGQDLNQKNLQRVAVRTRGLFKNTPLQAADLPAFAKARSTSVKAGISEEDFLSAAAILKQTDEAPEASTGLRNTILRIGAPSPTGKAALTRAGIDPKDVDLVGETLPQALKTLGQAIDALPEDARLPFAKDVFGDKVAASALNLIQGAQKGQFEAFGRLQGDVAGFEQGVNIARRGPNAALGKLEAQLQDEQNRLAQQRGFTNEELVKARRVITTEIRADLEKDSSLVGRLKSGVFETGEFLFGDEGLVGRHVDQRFIEDDETRKLVRGARRSDFRLNELDGGQNVQKQQLQALEGLNEKFDRLKALGAADNAHNRQGE